MSALGDMYNYWGYPRPVGLDAGKCCCNSEGGCDTDAIIGAVVEAIGEIETGCSCEEIDRKIEAAKEEIIRECKCDCGCQPEPQPTPSPCPCCDMCGAIQQAACDICDHIDGRFDSANIEGNFINLNELVSNYINSQNGNG